MSIRGVLGCCGILALSVCPLVAADFSSYRGFTFGASLTDAVRNARAKPSDVKTLHQRPALLQELDWRFDTTYAEDPLRPDPVVRGVLSFLDGKLHRIVITYDSYRIEGLTANDLIEIISKSFGPASQPGTEIVLPSIYADKAKVIARWQDEAYAYDLVRTGNQRDFALVLYSKSLDALAQNSATESIRLDTLDAPRRALADEKQRMDDLRTASEKARAKNKPNFRP